MEPELQKEENNQIEFGGKAEEEKVEKEENQEDKKDENDEKKKEENKEETIEEEKEGGKEENNEETKEDKKKNNKEKKKTKNKKNPEKKNLILTIDEENNKCVDCGKDNPTKVSINNGVIICEECSLEHEKLGHGISFVKDIDEDFDQYLLNFLVFGSNSKFKRFLTDEKVDTSLPIRKKYLTKAAFFYRSNLKRKVHGDNLLTKKQYENPEEIVENTEDDYPEFEHYKMKSKIMHEGELKKESKTLNKLGGSIMSLGKKMFGGIKIGANYVAKKTEAPAKTITKGAKIGAGFVGKQVSHAYELIKKNIIKGKKAEIEKEEENMDKNNPPNLNKKDNVVAESGRPLQADEEVKEEKADEQKQDHEPQQNDGDNNEEKIDI